MTQPTQKRLRAITGLAALWFGTSLLADGAPGIVEGTAIQPPEEELQLALTELATIQDQVEAFKRLPHTSSASQQEVYAERVYTAAKSAFGRKEFLATIRALSVYLNRIQVPEIKHYLSAQAMIGQSYEELGMKRRAIRAYLRYLAAFTTKPQAASDELIDVLRRLLPLADHRTPRENKYLGQLLSSLTTLKLPPELRSEVYFHAALAAEKSERAQLAKNWLATAARNSKDPVLQAKAYYQNALLAIKDQNYDDAEGYLNRCLELRAPAIEDYTNLALLALARIMVHEKKPNLALGFYDRVAASSPAAREAVFERVYVYLGLERSDEARAAALSYLAKYADGHDAYQLRTLVSYLDLRAGRIGDARSSLKAADDHLAMVDEKLVSQYHDKERLTYADVQDLQVLTEGQVLPPPMIDQASRYYGRLAESASRLHDLRSDLRNTVYTLGRTSLGTLHPALAQRVVQLEEIATRALTVGHRLIKAEAGIYRDELKGNEQRELLSSERRRERFFSQVAEAKRRRGDWQNWATLADLNLTVGARHDELARIEAALATATYTLASARLAGHEARLSEIDGYRRVAQKLATSLNRVMELVRAHQVQGILGQSPHRPLKDLVRGYAGSLFEESLVLEPYRNAYATAGQKYLGEDSTKAWQRWQFVVKSIYDEIEAFEGSLKAELTGTLKDIDQSINRHDELMSELGAINDRLERTLGENVSYIVSHYRYGIAARRAKHRKWAADLEWLAYQNATDERVRANQRFELEGQILKENLKDLQQGVLWPWPQ